MNTTPQPTSRRNTIFIKKELQLRYMVLIILSVLCGLAIMTFELTATLSDLFDTYPVLVQPLYDEFIPIAASFFYKIAIYLLFVVIISAFLSHKMAGPVYRFEQVCKALFIIFKRFPTITRFNNHIQAMMGF